MVVGVTRCHLMDLVVETQVVAVGVAEQVRMKEGVVQRRVEDLLVGDRPAADGDPPEHLVPGQARCIAHVGQLPTCAFGVQIAERIVDADVGDRGLEAHLFVVGRVVREIGAGVRGRCAGLCGLELIFGPGAVAGEGAVEAIAK